MAIVILETICDVAHADCTALRVGEMARVTMIDCYADDAHLDALELIMCDHEGVEWIARLSTETYYSLDLAGATMPEVMDVLVARRRYAVVQPAVVVASYGHAYRSWPARKYCARHANAEAAGYPLGPALVGGRLGLCAARLAAGTPCDGERAAPGWRQATGSPHWMSAMTELSRDSLRREREDAAEGREFREALSLALRD